MRRIAWLAAASVQPVDADRFNVGSDWLRQAAQGDVGRVDGLFLASGGRSGSPARCGRRPRGRSPRCSSPGRSVALSDAVHIGSSVPLTMRRLSASSLFWSVASALTSVCRRVASSACACTMSIGAMVPISTRARLSCTSFDDRSSAARWFSRFRMRVGELPIGVPHLRHRARGRGLQIELGLVLLDGGRQERRPRVVDLEVREQRLRVGAPGSRSCRPGQELRRRSASSTCGCSSSSR